MIEVFAIVAVEADCVAAVAAAGDAAAAAAGDAAGDAVEVDCVAALCLSSRRISVPMAVVGFVALVEVAVDSSTACSLAERTSNVARDFLCPGSPCCDDVVLCLPCYVVRTEVFGSF